ncbi:hypothetical protein BH11MYX1_BH11MYX1_52490 [soil metagenome]
MLWAGCAGTQDRGHKAANSAVVIVTSNLADAQVYVDGRFVGAISFVKAGMALDPGRHRFELRHDDYFSRFAELDLHKAEKKQLELVLSPVLP